ncbi:MAG: hypothetical protein K0Q84_587, partial [Arthrobacter sp.]|nr:hypothetical protein [Arthrobacter sp.]
MTPGRPVPPPLALRIPPADDAGQDLASERAGEGLLAAARGAVSSTSGLVP